MLFILHFMYRSKFLACQYEQGLPKSIEGWYFSVVPSADTPPPFRLKYKIFRNIYNLHVEVFREAFLILKYHFGEISFRHTAQCLPIHCPKTLEKKIMLLKLTLYRTETCLALNIKNPYSLYRKILWCIWTTSFYPQLNAIVCHMLIFVTLYTA
jgi:hypothetical protein